MSKSKRKTPKISITCIGSKAGIQRLFRSKENRAKRKQVKIKLLMKDYENLPHEKEYGNEWSSPRDGKQWMGKNSKWLRK